MKKRELFNYTSFLKKTLFPKEMYGVKIYVKPDRRLLKREGLDGLCCVQYAIDSIDDSIDDEITLEVAPRKFYITYCPWQTKDEIMKVIAHEFVHIRQYVQGDMRDTLSDYTVWWKGVVMEKDDYAPIEEYEKQPWEAEAFGREDELYNAYIDFCGKNK